MAIDTSVQGFTGFYEPPPQEAPVSTRDFLRGFLRGAQAGAASREFKKAKEELEVINRSREEGEFEALGPQGRTAFENRTGFNPDILENRKPPGAVQGILGAALGPDLQAQEGQLNQLAIAREQRQSQLASRQFAAQDAYRNAVARDLSALEQQGKLTDEEAVKVAAKHYLRYGGPGFAGFGGALGGMISTGQRADAAELRARTAEEAVAQRAKTAAEAEAGRQSRSEALNKLRRELAEVRNTRGFAPPEIGRLVQLRDAATAAGDTDTAEIYDREITIHQAKSTTTAKSRIHTELATTLRQEMRAIDANTKLSKAQKEEAKAPLLRQLEASRRAVLSELEPELPDEQAPIDKATADALANIDKQIADLEVDLKRNPKQGRLDLGKDNRLLKLDDLKAQRDRLQKQQPATAPTNTAPTGGVPPVPINPAERQAGQMYRLPLGDFKWTGTGWIKP